MRRYWDSLAAIFLVGFAARLIVTAYLYRYHINPILDHWKFGWEMGKVAKSIFLGNGFSSPLFEPSGPTAWMAPVYPSLIALSFKIFGLHTVAASWAMCTLNSVAGALTALCVYHAAKRTFGPRVAPAAGWAWALFPYSVYVASGRLWENSLTALLMSAALLQTLRVEERPVLWRWVQWGALWGVAALTSPSLLAPLPFLGLWLAYRSRRKGERWFAKATASAIVFFAMITPWIVRNYVVFDRFIFIRDNFWLEVHVGNNGDTSEPTPLSAHPSAGPNERAQWNQLGELKYMEAKKAESLAFIRENPGLFAWLTVRRFIFTWTAFWSLTPYYLEEEPFTIANVMFTTSLTVLLLMGLSYGRRNGYREMLAPYVIVLISFPLVYYFTHPSVEYRHPLEPVIVVLASYAVVVWLEKRISAKQAAAKREAVELAHSPLAGEMD